MQSSGLLEAFPSRVGSVLAHQGGWDEILLVVGPLAVVGLLLWVANRRVAAQLDAVPDGDASPDDRDPDRRQP